jgi:spore coat protein U-like protein
MKSVLRTACAAALASTVAVSGIAVAASPATSNLGVSASVTANCTITTVAVAFGAYDPVSANAAAALTNSGKVTVNCTNGSPGSITLGQGANANTGSTAAIPLRRMLAGTTNYLSYALYSDSGLATVWADTPIVHTGTGVSTDLTVYGSVAAGQNVPVGSYADTVVATITF